MRYSLELSDSQKKRIFEKIKKKYLREQYPSANPQGIILGGQPGSGKSRLPKKITEEFKEDFIFISTDDLRQYHPAYKELQQNPETVQNAANDVSIYANEWTEKLVKHCIENKYNLIIDSTLGNSLAITYKTIDMFKDIGYQIHLRVMAIPAIISKLSIFVRYEEQLTENGFARWTRMEDHDDRFENLETNLLQLTSRYKLNSLKFYERVFDDYKTIGIECLSQKEIKNWAGFENSRVFTFDKIPYLINTFNRIGSIIQATGRNKLDFETFVQNDLSFLEDFKNEVKKLNPYIIELIKTKQASAIIDDSDEIQEFLNS